MIMMRITVQIVESAPEMSKRLTSEESKQLFSGFDPSLYPATIRPRKDGTYSKKGILNAKQIIDNRKQKEFQGAILCEYCSKILYHKNQKISEGERKRIRTRHEKFKHPDHNHSSMSEMRLYGFRGKDAVCWHYGLLAKSAGLTGQPEAGVYISNSAGNPYAYKVIPESVGEFSGEYEDRNKTKPIFEGDRVEVSLIGINYSSKRIKGTVTFKDGCFDVVFDEETYDRPLDCMRKQLYLKSFVVNRAVVVIGNTYENNNRSTKEVRN